jgi:hypothetical protein
MGTDDFIVAYGEQAYRDLVNNALADEPQPRGLDDWRNEMARGRLNRPPGKYLDRSPVGTGKSHADVEPARRAGSSLIVVPTHRNADEVEELFSNAGLFACAYPAITDETCANYDEAILAIGFGLAASSAVCPGCNHRHSCTYQFELKAAEEAAHRIACHARAVFALAGLSRDAKYIAIHEDCLGILAPVVESSSAKGFERLAKAADAAGQKAAERDNPTQRHYFWRMADLCYDLSERLT